MAKISLNNITSGFNVSKINENFSRIVDHLQNKVLYRNNPVGEPNELVNDVDVNGKRLYNLPVPDADNQAARLKDVRDALQGVTGAVPFPASLIPADDGASGSLFTTVQGGLTYLKGRFTALASSIGSSLVGFIQSGVGAVLRTLQDKSREIVSVTDYGIVGAGGDDTAVFTLAQNAAQFIEVPAGLVCNVNSGLNYWKFFGRGIVKENGRQWNLTPYPQTGMLGKFYVERTYGNFESAVGASITVNSNVGQTKENTQILGTNDTGALAQRNEYDHAGVFVSAYSYIPDVLDATTTYTSTTLTNSAVGALNTVGKIKYGSYILTMHAVPCLGQVQSVSGNTVTVNSWSLSSTGATTTPANSIAAIINPNNKIFGGNFEVSATGNGTTTGANRVAGLEIGVSTLNTGSPVAGTYGIDLVSRTNSYLDLGYQIRGKRNIGFFSNPAGGVGLYGFRSEGDGRGLSVVDSTIAPIEVQVGGGTNTVLAVAPSGALTISPLNTTNGPLALNGNGQTMLFSGSSNAGYTQGYSGLATVLSIAKNTAQNRSINAAGTVNVNGADYAEYHYNNGLFINKGQIVGFKSDGTLTLSFSESKRFGVKSTDPGFVGGDFGSEETLGITRPVEPQLLINETQFEYDQRVLQYQTDWNNYQTALENARKLVDRIAYAGRVPVNVYNTTPGDYIVVKVGVDNSIEGIAINPDLITFSQYQNAIGRVNRILEDGRAEIAVMVH